MTDNFDGPPTADEYEYGKMWMKAYEAGNTHLMLQAEGLLIGRHIPRQGEPD